MQKISALLHRFPRWAAIGAGALSAYGFAPWGLWPLTLACFALLIHLIAHAQNTKRAFILGWLFGVGHFTSGNQWIAVAFTFQAAMPIWLGYIAVVALALYLAVYPALAAAGAVWIRHLAAKILRHSREGGNPTPEPPIEPDGQALGSRLRGSDDVRNGPDSLPLIVAFAGLWIITEWLRSWVFTGFIWNPLAVGFVSHWFDLWLPTIGTYGVGGLMILASGAMALLGSRRWTNGFVLAAIVGVAILSSVKIYVTEPSLNARTAVTVVQPNISQADKYAPGYDALNFAKLAMNSRPLPDQAPRLILWPEAAIPDYLEDGYPYRYYQGQAGESAAGARARLTTLMADGDVLVTGANRLVFEKGQLVAARNSVSAMDAFGRILGHYDKAHLVPYGEYLPMPWLLRPLGLARLVPGDLDFWPGPGAQTITVTVDGKPVKIGMQVCYEIIFSGQTVDRKNRPDFIFNPSNDAWFGNIGPPQHLAQAQLRAIEEGLPVIRATPTGISAIIDADGRITQSLPLGTDGRIDAFLPFAKAPTLFARFGNVIPLAFAGLLILAALLPLARRRG
ncbi:apolipoprotein N-acyltransferase [Sphingorhabdus sp.]|uniref:apolipoprotein N-acyltransferase n=1 Tax=Sphingorhabdus sp. TaxID=1902408 RepID=UPI0025E0B5EC|nr:apolipoprotein N-acyltransferase [Sphingorhabdus sp.]